MERSVTPGLTRRLVTMASVSLGPRSLMQPQPPDNNTDCYYKPIKGLFKDFLDKLLIINHYELKKCIKNENENSFVCRTVWTCLPPHEKLYVLLCDVWL